MENEVKYPPTVDEILAKYGLLEKYPASEREEHLYLADITVAGSELRCIIIPQYDDDGYDPYWENLSDDVCKSSARPDGTFILWLVLLLKQSGNLKRAIDQQLSRLVHMHSISGL